MEIWNTVAQHLCFYVAPVTDGSIKLQMSHVEVIVRSPANQHREYSVLVAPAPSMGVYNAIYEASVKLDNKFAESNPLDFRLEVSRDRDCYVIGDISGSMRSSSHVWVITVLDRNEKVGSRENQVKSRKIPLCFSARV